MQTFRIWAEQRLYASEVIEAEDLGEAIAIAEHKFLVTGELDPQDINDADCGAEPE